MERQPDRLKLTWREPLTQQGKAGGAVAFLAYTGPIQIGVNDVYAIGNQLALVSAVPEGLTRA